MRIALSVVSFTYRQLTEMCVCIRETIRRVLNLPMTTIMEYKSNNGMSNIILATSSFCSLRA